MMNLNLIFTLVTVWLVLASTMDASDGWIEEARPLQKPEPNSIIGHKWRLSKREAIFEDKVKDYDKYVAG